jgi:hypothetical protein
MARTYNDNRGEAPKLRCFLNTDNLTALPEDSFWPGLSGAEALDRLREEGASTPRMTLDADSLAHFKRMWSRGMAGFKANVGPGPVRLVFAPSSSGPTSTTSGSFPVPSASRYFRRIFSRCVAFSSYPAFFLCGIRNNLIGRSVFSSGAG